MARPVGDGADFPGVSRTRCAPAAVMTSNVSWAREALTVRRLIVLDCWLSCWLSVLTRTSKMTTSTMRAAIAPHRAQRSGFEDGSLAMETGWTALVGTSA